MNIHSKIKTYSVEFKDDILSCRDVVCDKLRFDKLHFFVDKNVHEIYRPAINAFTGDGFQCIIEAKEENKDYLKLADYYGQLIKNTFTRNDILITIGGGVLQDISGFIASTLYRGVRWIFIPTTLLSQADSCIGSKTSINFEGGKNLIGSFYPPDRIFIDPLFCKTLSVDYFNSGLGEIIKFHLLSDHEGYQKLGTYLSSKDLRAAGRLKDIILSTLMIKKSYFEQDEFDVGRRNLLNYGHCFGHALESASKFSICHGEAVIVGMGFANLLSLKRGLLKEQKFQEWEGLLRPYYPRFKLSQIDVEEIIKYLKKDKKRIGQDLTMILGQDIGCHQKADDIKEEEIVVTYQGFLENYPEDRSGR